MKIIDNWWYSEPDKEFDKNGRRAIIKTALMGPLETVYYGITEEGKYYWEDHIIEGFPEEIVYFEYIDRDKMLKILPTI